MTLRQRKHDKFLTFYAATQKPKRRVRLGANLSKVIRDTVRILNKIKRQSMREIKFRAWDAETQEMHLPQDYRHDTVRTASAHMLKHFSCVMQFTGLKDKNGVEIYESDIIEYIDNPTNLCSGTFEVVFDAGFIGIHSHYGLHLNDIEPHKWATVIGNIHQHPNLLTKQ